MADPNGWQAQLVLAATAHNPSIVSPHWLQSNGIVPEDLTVGDPVVNTPMVAQAIFDDWLLVVVLNDRLIVASEEWVDETKLRTMAGVIGGYTQALKHINYVALGTNFSLVVRQEQPHAWIKANLLSATERTAGATGASVSLRFDQPDGILTIGVSPRAFDALELTQPPVVDVAINLHRPLPADQQLDLVQRAADSLVDDWRTFCAQAEIVIKGLGQAQ